MRFPKNKSRVEEVTERSWDLSSHKICRLYVAPDPPCQPASPRHHVPLIRGHILLLLHMATGST